MVVALGVASLIWGISGFGAVFGPTDPVSDLESGGEFSNEANDSAVTENSTFDASAQGSDSDNIVGIIVSGGSRIAEFAGMVALLPWELQRLGVPYYAAYPFGLMVQAIVGIGVVQFAANRVFR